MGKVVTFGEVMMRLSPPGYAKFSQATSLELAYGGGEANVAISLAYLGLEAVHTTVFPDNVLGRSATQFLRQHWLNTDHIKYSGEMIGKYFLEKGAVHRSSEVIYEREGSAFSKATPELFDWDEILKDADWFHWTGITPAISKNTAIACKEAISAANRMGVTVSGDIHSRKNMWNYEGNAQTIMPDLIEGCDVVIASSYDIHEIYGVGDPGRTFSLSAKELMNLNPRLKKVIGKNRETMSASHHRIQGKMWNGEEYIKTENLDVTHIVDRVGTGDAYAAGLIYALHNDYDDMHALKFATAACALKHTLPGDVNMVSFENVQSLMKGDTSGSIKR